MRYRFIDGYEFEAGTAVEICTAIWKSMKFSFRSNLQEWMDANASVMGEGLGEPLRTDTPEPNHKRLNGAGYDIIFTFTGLKAGETTMIIEQRSPIATNADRLYTVKVDDRLHVEIILQNVHELGRQ